MFGFGNKEEKKEGGFETPNMVEMMALAGELIMALGDSAKMGPFIAKMVQKFATDANLQKMSSGMISGMANYQAQKFQRFALRIEMLPDNSDIGIWVYSRNEDLTETNIYHTLYLSQITQQDIINLLAIIFSNEPNNTGQRAISSPAIGQ